MRNVDFIDNRTVAKCCVIALFAAGVMPVAPHTALGGGAAAPFSALFPPGGDVIPAAQSTTEVTTFALALARDRILNYCASAHSTPYLNPKVPIARASVQVLSRLIAGRASVGVTDAALRGSDIAPVNAALKDVLTFSSAKQMNCFAEFMRVGRQFDTPPNACRVRDNEFPTYIRYPMWWFALTFNRPAPGAASVMRYAPGSVLPDGSLDAQRVDGQFPVACIVGYDEAGLEAMTEVQCVIAGDATAAAKAAATMQWERVAISGTAPYDNGIVTMNGSWHIECPVDMTGIVNHVNGGAGLPPRWQRYDTFWLKASGKALWNGGAYPFVYVRPNAASVSIVNGGGATPAYPAAAGNAGLSVDLGLSGGAGFRINAQLSNTVVSMTWPTATDQGLMHTWGAHVTAQNGATQSYMTQWYKPDLAASVFMTQAAWMRRVEVPFYPVGTFFVGFNPDTSVRYVGQLDETIVDPSDVHPP